MNRTGAQFNRVSGRKEHGAAVTAKVYTLGNSFELTGRDFYEKGRGEEQAIKENRLNANERRRRANRERARLQRGEKQHERAANHHAPQGRIVDRFGYQKRRTDGPGPTTAGFEAPRALPRRSRAKNNAVQRKKANVQRRQPRQEPDLTVNRPTVSSQRLRGRWRRRSGSVSTRRR